MAASQYLLVWIVQVIVLCASSAVAQSNAEVGLEGHVYSQKTNKVLPGAIVQVMQFVEQTNANSFAGVTANSAGFYVAQFNVLTTDPADFPTLRNTIQVLCKRRGRTYVSPSTFFYVPLQPGNVYQRDFYLNVPSSVKVCD